MDLRDLFGYLFILAGLLQLLTAYLIFAGQRHYVLTNCQPEGRFDNICYFCICIILPGILFPGMNLERH